MQKLFKNKLVYLLLGIFLVAAGCGGGSTSGKGSGVNLEVWGTFESTDNMQQFISDYLATHPGVQINYTEKNVDSYEEDILNALAAGKGPDIFAIHNDWLPKYKDKIVEAPNNILTYKDYKAAFVDAAVNDFTLQSKVYAMPLSVDTLALYYNKDILGSLAIAVPPRTWDEMKADVRKVVQADRNGFNRAGVAMGTTANINRAVDIAYLLMLQNGTVPYTADNSEATFDQATRDSSGNTVYPAAQALDFFTTFSNPSSDVYTWNARSNYSIDAFAAGNLAFMYGYSYARDTILQKAPNLNFDIAAVPQPNFNQNLVNYPNYWGFAVSKQSKNPDWAWSFLKAVGSKESLTKYYERHKLPSSRKDLISDQVADPEIGVFASQALTAKSFYKYDAGKVDSIFEKTIDDIVLRGKTVQQALSDASNQVNFLQRQQQR